MSASQATIARPLGAPGQERLRQLLTDRLAPPQGWDTYLLLLASLGVVVWTVLEANWADTPGLMPVVLFAATLGLALSRVRVVWPLPFLLGLSIGLVVVVWQASSLITDVSYIDRVREFWSRLSIWYEAATTGGISTDLLPITVVLLAFGWLMGFVSSWFLFRLTNVWVPVVVPAVAMLTNLSFLPEEFELRFLIFMFFAMLLVARTTAVQRRRKWHRSRVGFGPGGGWLSLRTTAVFSILVLAIAGFLPLRTYVSRMVADVWIDARSPIESLEDEFARLFSGIPSRKDLAGRYFGSTLPFIGKIKFGGEVVMRANSEEPTYWLSQTYSEYTSKGWIAGEAKKTRVGAEFAPPPSQESFNRTPINQSLEFTFKTSRLLTGGNLQWVSREPVVETLEPKQFTIDVQPLTSEVEFPDDIKALASDVRRMLLEPHTQAVESEISRMLPLDLVLVGIASNVNSSAAQYGEVTLARREPLVADVVSWKFVDAIEKGGSYAMGSLISKASDGELRRTGTSYSGFIKDHYLQLPSSLPQRIRDLATSLTRDAEAPLDKALAIQEFLRGPTFEYSQDIEAPPQSADGVDHFLFETKMGYSDYFGSSMAVMLRSVGVPARLAAGYAPGELGASGRWAVKDSDSHGWTQVYFPGHGWIDFEPTPKWPVAKRGAFSGSDFDEGAVTSPDDEEDFSGIEQDCETPDAASDVVGCPFELESDTQQLLELLAAAEDEAGAASNGIPFLAFAIVLGALGGLWAVVQLVWVGSLARVTHTERLYTKMSRLGTLAGFRRTPQQTPIEYATALGNAIPSTGPGSRQIAWAFAAGRYGRGEPTEQDGEELSEAWKGVRGGLIGRALKRLVLLGGT